MARNKKEVSKRRQEEVEEENDYYRDEEEEVPVGGEDDNEYQDDDDEDNKNNDLEQENDPSYTNNNVKKNMNKSKSVTATDAEFMEWASSTTATSNADGGDDDQNNLMSLHKSNLLRLQIQELLDETVLSMDPSDHSFVLSSSSSSNTNSSIKSSSCSAPKWTTSAQDYVQTITKLIQEQISLSNKPIPLEDPNSPFLVDNNKHNNATSDATLPLSKEGLRVVPKAGCGGGSFANHNTNVGFTKTVGNAHILPTIELWVLLPTATLLEGKDYMKHRYFQKRNAIIWHVAQQLTKSKKMTKQVGKVYWRGTREQPTLLLIPPTAADDDTNNNKKKNKKRAKKNHDNNNESTNSSKKNKKLRFRLELHFGMDNLDWIQPQIRLSPNRSNLGGNVATSHYYNYRLTRDASHALTPMTLASSDANGTSNLKELYPHWNEVVVLTKIWCLQRGILNRHDGLTVEHIALLILYMYRTKLVGPRMGPPQVMSALFKLLAETDWIGEGNAATSTGNGDDDKNLIRRAPSEGYRDENDSNATRKTTKRTVLVMPNGDGKSESQTVSEASMANIYAKQTATSPLTPDDPKTLLELYETTYTLGPVFLDSSMTHNFFGQVSPACIRFLQQEAKRGLDYLHAKEYDKPFQLLFMTEARFYSKSRYDGYLRVPLRDVSFKNTNGLWGHDRKDVGDYESIARGIVHVLHRALGDRVSDIQLLSTGNGTVAEYSSVDPSDLGVRDSDEIPASPISHKSETQSNGISAPNGKDMLVLGISINSDTCFRVVDRGPPADDHEATHGFLQLWGEEKAELRRFKDGAIVHAVVWDDKIDSKQDDDSYVRFQNDDKVQGGIVERIIRHILRLHFVRRNKQVTASYAMRDILSTVDGVIPDDNKEVVTFNPLVAHRMVMRAFEDLSSFLRQESLPSVPVPGSDTKRSRLGIPLTIDAVEPLDPALRYAELFPPIPHPFLGGSSLPGIHKASGAVSSNPIQIQLRFGSSSKWPTDLKAMGAAKTAMLLQLADGIESLKDTRIAKGFEGSITVTPDYIDLCYKGYVFRVLVRADPQLKLLRELSKPSEEASNLLRALTKKHVVAAKHHSMVHAVYTSHPSSSMVVRAVRRWMATHLFSGLIPFEAVELMVCHIYTGKDTPFNPPATVIAGLQRFFDLLSCHDWEGEPLIVDPQGHLHDSHRREILKEFASVRGPEYNRGPAMFIVTPNDRVASDDEVITPASKQALDSWLPAFTSQTPELVVLARARQLAKRSYEFLTQSLRGEGNESLSWSSLFQESTQSFRAYSALLRVDPDLVFDREASSSAASALVRRNEKLGVLQSSYSRSMYNRYHGPGSMQLKLFKNLMQQKDRLPEIMLEFNPVVELVQKLRQSMGQLAVFWYNDLCPEVVTVLWRPNLFAPKSFSAVSSEYVRPVVENEWQKDTLTTVNVHDILAELSSYCRDIVVDQKVLDNGMAIPPPKIIHNTKKRSLESDDESSSSEEEEEEEEEEKRGASDDESSSDSDSD